METHENEEGHPKIDHSIELCLEDDQKKLRSSQVLTNLSMTSVETFRIGEGQPRSRKGSFSESQPHLVENKPVLKVEVSLAISQNALGELFSRLCAKKGYEVIDNERDQITAIKRRPVSFVDCILSCINGKKDKQKAFSCIRMGIRTNKITCKRKLTLKGVSGDPKLANQFFQDFQAELEYHDVKKSPSLKTATSFFADANSTQLMPMSQLSRQRQYSLINEENNSDGEDSGISNNNMESYSVYEFHKLLSSDQYTLGKKMADFVRDFLANYKNIEESAELLPQPIESVYLMINETVDTLFCDFNYGKSETKKMMPYCRVSVEKYLFEKLYSLLFAMYLKKYETISAKYFKQCTDIMDSYGNDPVQALKYLDINKKFWLIPAKLFNESGDITTKLDIPTPYHDSIQELYKLPKLKTPREKLNVLLMMHSAMKSSVVDFHHGKEELQSMDDELPIIIYIVMNAKIPELEAELAYVEDFINLDPTLESEKRLMTNIRVSVQFIVKEWKIETPTS
jgi:hypothetical protein